MGYWQDVLIAFRKPGVDGKVMYLALQIRCQDFIKTASEWATDDFDFTFKEEGAYMLLSGESPMYRRTGVLFDGAVDLGRMSKELECTIEVYYEGEDRGDCEIVAFDCGKIVNHKVLKWVDVE